MKKEVKKLLDVAEKNKTIINDTPKLYSVALDQMNNLVWDKISDEFPADKLMFTNNTAGGVIRIYVNRKLPEEYQEYLELHEFGHILFGHTKENIINIHKNQLKKKCLQNWSSIVEHLELTKGDQNLTKIELANKYIIPLSELFLNYAEDFEVNSKLYSKEEWQNYINLMDYADIIATLKDFPDATDFDNLGQAEQKEYLDKLKRIEDWLNQDADKKQHWSHPLWPEDYDMPLQKSCAEYIDLIFQNIDKFMNFVRQEAQNQQGNGQGQQSNGRGQSSQSQNQQSNGQNQQSNQQNNSNSKNQPTQATKMGGGMGNTGNGKHNQPVPNSANNKQNPLAKAMNESLRKLSLNDIEKLRKQANRADTDAKSNASHGSKADKAYDESTGNTWSGQDGLGFGHSRSRRPDVMPLGNGKELAQYIERESFSKKIENTHSNIMYYYNRRKYGTVDVVTKETSENVYRPGNIYVIVDCSGSIDENAIKKMLNVIKQLSKKCGPKSRVIWWDTQLCKDTLLRDQQEPICGGGTDIAEGIKYVKDKYLKNSNDRLFIISDYCDSLEKWYDEAKNIKNEIIGICWVHDEVKKSAAEYIKNVNYGSGFNASSFLKKIKTKIVSIN